MRGWKTFFASTGLLVLTAFPAGAIGVGEMALASWSGGKLMGEVRVLPNGQGNYKYRKSCPNGRAFWYGDYHVREVKKWHSKGYKVYLDYRAPSGRRHVCPSSKFR